MPLAAQTSANKLTIKGSSTIVPIAQRAAYEFMDINPDVSINVLYDNSSSGITSLIEGTCDIADSSRAMKYTELLKAAIKGISPKAHVIAMDGIVVIVNPANPVTAVTKKQVKDIFTGKISNWAQVGGTNEKIVVLTCDSASGTFEVFGTIALGGQKVRPDALKQSSNQAVATTVATTPGAIGYVGTGYVSWSVKAIPVEGISASKQTVLSRKYPYSRPLFMYTSGEPKGKARDFIDFLLSNDGQKLVEEEGFFPLK